MDDEFTWDNDYTPLIEDDILEELSGLSWEEILESTDRAETEYLSDLVA